MARIKKYSPELSTHLRYFETYLVDTISNSQYFKVTEFKDVFTGGKNGFLIEGSEHLMESTEIKIEILDVDGNPIYYEPGNGVPEYYEGLSKVIAVYVYEDTPIGEASITILGELKTYIDESGNKQDIPAEWKGIYNVKWEKTFKVNKLLANEDKVRFYRRPSVSINEIVKPIFSNVVTPIIQKGKVDGFAQVPTSGTKLAGYTLPTSYLLQINDGNSAWTGSVAGTNIELTDLGVSLTADDIINNRDLTVSTPYTLNGIVQDFTNQRYTASFNYLEGLDNLKTALTGSFAKITLADLTTFIGDVARVKVFRKSSSDLADYQFIQEVQLESNELLVDIESKLKNQENYGLFDVFNYNNIEYWLTSSNNLDTSFNQTYLFNSVRLDNTTGINSYFTSKSLQLTEGAEYSFTFNTRLAQNIPSNNYLKVYLSGSRETTVNNVPVKIGVQQNIVTVTPDSSILEKSQITSNFKAENIKNARLHFEVSGTGWYISDVSLRASQETSFSPDEITFIQPIPRTLPKQTFDFLFQFYDINNNYIPVVVEESKTFDGGNLVSIAKNLELIPSSLYFQIDSGSQPLPPTTIFIDVVKSFLTGSVTFTSRSFDFFNNELSASQYAIPGGQYPGRLDDIDKDTVRMTVENFTGSREDIKVQFVELTGACEGVSDTIVITRVQDGFGGVNFEIRPYNGIVIRNSDPSSSLEVQAIRIDGVNEIPLRENLPFGRSDVQLFVQSGSTYITLQEASDRGFVRGLSAGTTGSGELNYNAVLNRDSIDGQRTLYMIPSSSFDLSSSILTSLTLTDLQDGLDAGIVLFDVDAFTINPRLESIFTPTYASATASFYRRGTFDAPISCSFEVYPSMSINIDYVPEYWMQYVTHSCNPDISVVAYDEVGNLIPARANAATYPLGDALQQSKQILLSFVYTEPWTSSSVSVDKLFTIVPEGKPGDESIVFEITPKDVVLAANSRGSVNDYKPSITDIKLKQGSRYLSFTASREPGTFHIAQNSIIDTNVTVGNVYFDVNYTSSLIVSQSNFFVDLSGSIEYPLEIQPYYTSSVYTASVIQNYTKVLDGPPPIEIIISPLSANISANEVGYVIPSNYNAANTTIKVKEGDDRLTFTTQSNDPGTFRILSVSGSSIRTGSLSSSSFDTGTINYNRFDYPFVSASSLYTIEVYPYALGPGHRYTSSIYQRTQTFTKNVSVPNARSLSAEASSATVNYDRDGNDPQPSDVKITANAFNTTGSIFYYYYILEPDGSETLYENTYTSNNGEVYAWSEQNYIDIDASNSTAPGEIRTWKVKIKDGSDRPAPLTPTDSHPFRAEASVTIAGIKAGADAYKYSATNLNTSITADLWSTQFTGSGIQISAYKGTTELAHTSSYVVSQEVNDFLGNFIGNLGYFSASVHSKSPWITLAQNPTKFPPSNPAVLTDITAWNAPAVNTSGEVIYKIDYEKNRQIDYVTQSISVQYTSPAPYDVKMQNDSSGVVYRVSGEFELNNTGNIIRAYRGDTELTNISNFAYATAQPDAYGAMKYKDKCRISILSISGHITLQGITNPAGAFVSSSVNAPKGGELLGISTWTNPEVNQTAEIVYQIDCEDRATFFKTQSLSVQFEGNTGPGIVMRGIWKNNIDYIGSVETTNKRRDSVIWPDPATYNNETHYWAAASGSGPGTSAGFRQPDNGGSAAPWVDSPYWQYLGQEEFFVAAQIAIFQESYVKNTINVGTKDGTSGFANIILAGGRPDPYIAIGQTGTQGTAGTSGTSLPPAGIIGYDRPGVFLGIYENGTAGTTGRFSIKTTGTSGKGMSWDGDTLTIVGAIRQVEPGVSEGSLRGGWTSGFTYYTNDIVSYAGQSWRCTSAQAQSYQHIATNDTAALTGYPGSGPWAIAAAAGTSGTAGSGGTAGVNGAAGAAGPGVVYRGPWTGSLQYFKTTDRTDVVRGSDNQYYIAKVTHTPNVVNAPIGTATRPIDGASYSTYWQSFGATFSSVATGLLLAENATVTKGLVIGQEGSDVGFIRSAGAQSIGGGNGFYMDALGNMRFGADTSTEGNYVYWNNTLGTLDINGTITADSGEIGGFTIANNKLIASGALLRFDTQAPSIEFYTNATGSAKVVLNPKATLTDPSGQIIYISGSQYDGTDGNRTSTSGTTNTTNVITEVYSGSFGISANSTYSGATLAFSEAGNTNFIVYIPETSLTISTTSPSAASDYPPDPPQYGYETYQSEYAAPGNASAQWYVQMYNSTGTTFISEVAINGASTYRSGTSSNSYYTAVVSYSGFPYYTESYYWNYSSYSSTAYYQGNIPFGSKAGQLIIPAPGIYQFRLVLKVTAVSAAIYNYVGGGNTYYTTTGTSNHTTTGDITFQFSPNVNKTEITNGGIQVLSNQNAYVRFNRIEPSAYGGGSAVAEFVGGAINVSAFGGYPTSLSNTGIYMNGGLVSNGKTNYLGDYYFDGTGTQESARLGGRNTATAADQTYITSYSNFLPGSDNYWTIGKSGQKWKQIWSNTGTIQTSDATQKLEIEQSQLGLDFINRLQPVSYKFISGSAITEKIEDYIKTVKEPAIITPDGTIIKEEVIEYIKNEQIPNVTWTPGIRKHHGLVAQHVKTILDDMGLSTNDFAGYIEGDLENHSDLGLRYEEFMAPMIKAIQELASKVDRLEAHISGSFS
jgi:hypothetical protein